MTPSPARGRKPRRVVSDQIRQLSQWCTSLRRTWDCRTTIYDGDGLRDRLESEYPENSPGAWTALYNYAWAIRSWATEMLEFAEYQRVAAEARRGESSVQEQDHELVVDGND
jgi:hypothetical protein